MRKKYKSVINAILRYLGKNGVAVLLFFVMIFTAVCATERDTADAASEKWIKKSGKKIAYIMSNGRRAKGVRKIGKTIYFFNSKGRLARSGREKMRRWDGGCYAVRKNGTVRKGWNVFSGSLYYFGGRLGNRQKNKVVDDIPLNSKGKAFMSMDASIKKKVIGILKRSGTFDASKKKKLRACWNWIQNNCHYSAKYPVWKKGEWKWGYSPWNSTGIRGISKHGVIWVKRYADDMLGSRRGGNCYGFACAFAACGHEIGYRAKIVVARARVGGMDTSTGYSRDGYTRHAWNRINGRVYDPEAATPGWGRYVYNRAGIGLRHKNTHVIDFAKVDGTKTYNGKAAARLIRSKLVRESGKVYYYDKNGKKTRPKHTVLEYKGKLFFFNDNYNSKKGKYVIKGKLYILEKKSSFGYYVTKKEFKEHRALYREGAAAKPLIMLLGPAKSIEEQESCYSDQPGKDRIYDYGDYYVNTFVPMNGKEETVISIESM